MNQENTWQFAAFGKHPAAKDYVKLGENSSFTEGFAEWVENGYGTLSSKAKVTPEFCSWRFWTKGSGKDSIICGVIRESSDSIGRPYPLFILGTGLLPGWEDNWELLPLACENTWVQLEYLATHKFDDVKNIETEMQKLRPPVGPWSAHSEKKKALNEIGSPLDPFASFIDLAQLKKQAAGLAGKTEVFVSLDRGSCTDKILPVSLWHGIFREIMQSVPSAMFLGGTLDKSYMAAFKRALSPGDFIQLWSVSSAGLWKNTIGAEYSMDLLTLGKESVSADRAGGQDVRYDPAFDELQAEVDKLSSPSASGSVNWEKIVRSAADILAHKSKDLLVASYLAVGLIYTRKHDGLSIGIKLLLDLMEKFWDDLYPSKERMRGRVRSIEWWTEKTEVAVKNLPAGSAPANQVAIMSEGLEKIEQFMQKRLDSAPSVSQIMEYIEMLAAPEDQSQPEAPSQPAPQATTIQEPPRASMTPVQHSELVIQDITSPQIAQRMLDHHLIKLREIASYLWQQDPANPMVYRLNRKSVWMTVDDLPPSSAGKTRIPPPDNQSIKMLFEMRNNGNTDALLKAAEGKLSQFIFWLDLNRYVAEALVRLGNRYEKAYEIACRETAALLSRLPGLEDLSFSDGMPFANSETKDWLRSIAVAAGPTGDESLPVQQTASTGADEKIVQEIGNAKGLIKKGKLIDAMVKLQSELTHAVACRDRMLWRIAVSQMLIEEKQGKIALPHIEQILADIDTYRLEEYEPALTLRALKLAWKGLEAQSDQANKLKANDILYRIARLDMAEAIRLGKN